MSFFLELTKKKSVTSIGTEGIFFYEVVLINGIKEMQELRDMAFELTKNYLAD